MSQPSHSVDFWRLPPELHCRIFDFYGARHTITVDQKTCTEASRINIGLPPISKDFSATARDSILAAATWQFSDISAAQTQLQATAEGSAIRHLRHLRIDARKIDPSRLLAKLSESLHFKPWSVTIVGCTPQNFNVTPNPAQTDKHMLMFGFTLPSELRDTTCRGFKTDGIVSSPLVRALQSVKSLRDVRVQIQPCGTCTMGNIGYECDHHLLSRAIEQITLCGRVGLEVENGQTRDLQCHLGEIEEEGLPLIKNLMERDYFEPIGTDVGMDMEDGLTDDELPDEEMADDEGYDTLCEE
ncbi:hypothetical protein HII31_07667 [Pseudocercospora fuligena]|uniref:Uncharacterized protein n=1 Tax=Pseudocercospora fuligena TaxID=685502 RepID=A0A8H6VGU5_9PEZI|nr:hypothetical protein HII31_07667 [Pseudocercospora fuligena]